MRTRSAWGGAVLALLLVAAAGPAAEAIQYQFVGSKVCAECHKAIYDSWSRSAHAKVYELLRPGQRDKAKKEAGLKPEVDYTGDRSCMECHVTGYGAGGFDFAKPEEKWKGIGCEECHGASERWLDIHYKKNVPNKDRELKRAQLVEPFAGKTVCARCHGHMNSPYRYRLEKQPRDFTDKEMAKTYHVLPEPDKPALQ